MRSFRNLMASGRGWAYLTLILGSLVSVTGNVLDMRRLTINPDWFDYTLSGMWPVWLFLGIEVHARVPWEKKWTHHIVRHGGLSLAATLSAFVSYGHLHELMIARNQGFLTALLGPLVVDGVMAMSTMALVLTRVRPSGQPDSGLTADVMSVSGQVSDLVNDIRGQLPYGQRTDLPDTVRTADAGTLSGHPDMGWLSGHADNGPDTLGGHDLADTLSGQPDSGHGQRRPPAVRTGRPRTADMAWKRQALLALTTHPDWSATQVAVHVFDDIPPTDSNRRRVSRLMADLTKLRAEPFRAKHGVDPTGMDD